MNFKDLQYSIGKLKSDVQTHIAKNNPMQKQDTKNLSLWIFEERNDLASMRTLGYQRTETNKALKNWITEEMPGVNTQDLEDIVGDKLVRLLDKQVQVEQEYTRKYQNYRQAIKSIREREDKMSDVREKKRSLQSRIANLTKTNTQSPKLAEFQKELRSLEKDTAESELDLANFKRFALKEAFYLRMNAMHAFAEKTALIAGFGKYLVDLIEVEQKEYERGPQAAVILADALNALDYWKPAEEDERSTYTLDPKGKAPQTPEMSNQTPAKPQLPPRPVGSEPQEVQQVTGDLKTTNESEIDLARIDLYDAPPAYEAPAAAPLNADRPGSFHTPYQSHASQPAQHYQDYQTHYQDPTYQETYQGNAQYQEPSGGSPYPQSQSAYSPYPQSQSAYSSYPAHAQSPYSPYPQSQSAYSPYPTHASPRPAHLQASYSSLHPQSSFSESAYPIDYHQLYRQASQRQAHHEYRPYEEFQQKYRTDAGGFRIPPPLSAQQEKEQLANYYGSDKTAEERKPDNKD